MSNKTKEFNLEDLTKTKNDVVNDDSIFKLADSDFELRLRIRSFPSAKEYENFIKSVEKLVRSSHEYRLWVHYITETLGYSTCAFTKESNNECPVIVHHHPITLYTIVKGVVNNFLSKEVEFSSFDVATKVIELHFQNKVGYVAMLSDLHSKYHSGFLNIPIEFVNGDYKHILQVYSIEENEYDKIVKLCGIHVEDVKQSWSRDNYPGVDEYVEKSELSKVEETKKISA
jgi:hypothetical protein